MMIKKILFGTMVISGIISCSTNSLGENLIQNNAVLTKVGSGFSFTEGPATDSIGNVYFTDQPNDKIYVWDWKSNQVKLFSNNTGRANGMYFNSKNELLSCSDNQGEISKFNSKGEKTATILTAFNGKRLNGPNDLWIDHLDGIYFTDPLYVRDYWNNFKQEIEERRLYYRDSKGIISALDEFKQPNGIIGSERLKKLYVSDIDDSKTYVYDIESEGKLVNKKLFCELGSDGMTLDEKGNLYLTGKGVNVFNPQGIKILHVPVDEDWTSNVTFGGKDRKTLFITASKSVYTLQMNVAGNQ